MTEENIVVNENTEVAENTENIETTETVRPKMTKISFLAEFCRRSNYTEKEAAEIYDLFLGIITDEVFKGNTVSLTGFGNFEVRVHTGHPVKFMQDSPHISDYPVLRFTPSHTLSKAMRGAENKDELVAYVKTFNKEKKENKKDSDNNENA